MALGIVTFALVSMLGMLPLALDTFRQSSESTTSSRIAQQIIAQAQETDFAKLTDVAGRYRYDDEGAEVTRTNDVIYAATVTVADATPPGTSAPDPRLRKVRIDITKHDRPLGKSFVTYVAQADAS